MFFIQFLGGKGVSSSAACGVMGVGGRTSYIWHSADVRAEWPPFSALPGI